MREQANVLIVGADRDATRAVAKAYAALSGARELDLDDYIAYTLGRSPEAALQVVDRAYVERVVGNCVATLQTYCGAAIAASPTILLSSAYREQIGRMRIVCLASASATAQRKAIDRYAEQFPVLCRGKKTAMAAQLALWRDAARNNNWIYRDCADTARIAKEIYDGI